ADRHIDPYGLDAPDLVCILLNGAIGREFAHIRNILNRHSSPLVRVVIGLADALLTLYVRSEVGKQHVNVAAVAQQRIEDRLEEIALIRAEISASDHIENAPQFSVRMVVIPRIVMRLERVHLFREETEDEDVVVSDLFANLDVRSVHSAYG